MAAAAALHGQVDLGEDLVITAFSCDLTLSW